MMASANTEPTTTGKQNQPPTCPASAPVLPNNNEDVRLPPKGVYSPPTKTDTRGPCPMLNTLANHGLIPRSGRNIQAREITSALHDVIGVSWPVAFLFTRPIFLVHRDPATPEKWWKSWRGIRQTVLEGPFNKLVFRWGMRRPEQYLEVPDKDKNLRQVRVINLDQLGTANAIEHDISLTRRDRGEPQGCMAKQMDLVEQLLDFQAASSPDSRHSRGDREDRDVEAAPAGPPMLTLQDLAGYRRHRIAQQRGQAASPEDEGRRIKYGKMEHSFACMEIALFLGVFGLSEEGFKKVPRSYARAFLMEERLPFEEGWVARGTKKTEKGNKGWWRCWGRAGTRRLGWFELIRSSGTVRKAIGKV